MMSKTLLRWVADYGLRVADESGILGRFHRGPSPVVLMYHGILWRKPSAIGVPAIDREDFIHQMLYLKRHFHIIHPNDFIHGLQSVYSNGKQAVVLTFDDGLASNATIAAPILHELHIPALCFVSVRHLKPRSYLWFMHARALFNLWPAREVELLGRTWKLNSATAREQAYQDFLYETTHVSSDGVYKALSQYVVEEFVPPRIIDEELRGMTEAELATIAQSNFIVIGSHTYNHPYLTMCTPMQLDEEIDGAKATLERICCRAVTTISYPLGDYNTAVISKVRQAGFDIAFAVNPRCEVPHAKMAIPRIGIYQPGLGLLAAKCYGQFLPR